MNNKELNNVYKNINNWYGKKTKVLNIKTRPFNTEIVFSNIISKVLRENKKVLYVLCNSNILNINKKIKKYIANFAINDYDEDYYNKITFILVDKITEIQEEYDLVIFDDITVFSNISVEKLREAVEDIYWKCSKIIIYTCEKAFPIGDKIDLVFLKSNTPIIEPRFISTRLKLEEEIPLALYDYYKWFYENKKTTLVFVPTEEKLNKVYNTYYNTLKSENMRVVKYIKGQSYSFIKDILEQYSEPLFIVTNNVDDYIRKIQNLNIIVLFSDDKYFSYKKLVYLCGTINKKENIISEVILVSKDVSDDMDKSKSITRGFNQKLWEKKLLNL